MKQDIKELEGTVSAIENQIRVIRSNLQNPEVVERMIADRQATIATLQKQVEQLRVSLLEGPQQIENLQSALREARAALQSAKDAAPPSETEKQKQKIDKKIEKLLQLKAELERLQTSC